MAAHLSLEPTLGVFLCTPVLLLLRLKHVPMPAPAQFSGQHMPWPIQGADPGHPPHPLSHSRLLVLSLALVPARLLL